MNNNSGAQVRRTGRSEPFVGIDLGTTNSVVSVAFTKGGSVEPEVLEVAQPNDMNHNFSYDRWLPSALYVADGTRRFVGAYAREMKGQFPDRVIWMVKRYMGMDRKWVIDDTEYTPSLVSSYYLTTLKKQAEQYLGVPVKRSVITVPASFNFQQVNDTRVAAQIAEFDDAGVTFISEPTAALLDFINEENKRDASSRTVDFSRPKTLAVFDLGGGTCDVSIIQAEVNGDGFISLKELGISRYSEMGGHDFDTMLAQVKIDEYFEEGGIDPDALDTSTLKDISNSFFVQAERAKVKFAKDMRAMENDPLLRGTLDQAIRDLEYRFYLDLPGGKPFWFKVKQTEYDAITSGLLHYSTEQKNIIRPIADALKKAKTRSGDVDVVFLVGGMTEYPTVAARVREYFQADNKDVQVRSIPNPMFAVSRGAAVYHYYRDRVHVERESEGQAIASRPIEVGAIVPESIFVEVERGLPVCIVEAGTPAPFEQTIKDKFFVGSKPLGLELTIFRAEGKFDPNPDYLRQAFLTFRTPQPEDTPITLKVRFDTNRELKVTAWLANDESQVVEVRIGEMLTSAEIKRLSAARGEINRID